MLVQSFGARRQRWPFPHWSENDIMQIYTEYYGAWSDWHGSFTWQSLQAPLPSATWPSTARLTEHWPTRGRRWLCYDTWRGIRDHADDLADWHCRHHRPALNRSSYREELRATLLRRACVCGGERIPTGHGFDTRASELKARRPTCCDRVNEPHGG